MKGEIAAYITAIINNHQRCLEKLEGLPCSTTSKRNHENFVTELTDLLDFVEDIPEGKQEPITITLTGKEEIRALNQRIKNYVENLKRSAIANEN